MELVKKKFALEVLLSIKIKIFFYNFYFKKKVEHMKK